MTPCSRCCQSTLLAWMKLEETYVASFPLLLCLLVFVSRGGGFLNLLVIGEKAASKWTIKRLSWSRFLHILLKLSLLLEKKERKGFIFQTQRNGISCIAGGRRFLRRERERERQAQQLRAKRRERKVLRRHGKASQYFPVRKARFISVHTVKNLATMPDWVTQFHFPFFFFSPHSIPLRKTFLSCFSKEERREMHAAAADAQHFSP